eukprot:g31608.t1
MSPEHGNFNVSEPSARFEVLVAAQVFKMVAAADQPLWLALVSRGDVVGLDWYSWQIDRSSGCIGGSMEGLGWYSWSAVATMVPWNGSPGMGSGGHRAH